MSTDDEAARKARAARLREQIARITKPDFSGDEELKEESRTSGPSRESPREFVERRMRELNKKKS